MRTHSVHRDAGDQAVGGQPHGYRCIQQPWLPLKAAWDPGCGDGRSSSGGSTAGAARGGLFGMGRQGKGHEGRKNGWLQGALSAEDASFPASTHSRAPSATPCGMSRQDSTTEDKQGSASRPLSCIGMAPEGDNRPMGTESHTPAGWLRTFSPERALSWR